MISHSFTCKKNSALNKCDQSIIQILIPHLISQFILHIVHGRKYSLNTSSGNWKYNHQFVKLVNKLMSIAHLCFNKHNGKLRFIASYLWFRFCHISCYINGCYLTGASNLRRSAGRPSCLAPSSTSPDASPSGPAARATGLPVPSPRVWRRWTTAAGRRARP